MSCIRKDNRVIVKRDSIQASLYTKSFEKKSLEDPTASVSVFLDYARSLARERKFKEAVSVFSLCSRLATLPMESIRELVDNLIEAYSGHAYKKTCYTDPWSCVFCATVLVEPVTLACGHSCCKKCLLKDLTGVCKKCGNKYEPIDEDPIDEAEHVKVSILVSELVSKFWFLDLKAVSLRNEGNRCFQRGDVPTSLEKYSEAFQLAPDDHLIASNRSHAYYRNEMYDEALEDAIRAIEIKPDWGKSYFRKGMVLTAKENYEDALVSYFQCLILEETCSKALRTEIFKVTYKLVSHKYNETEDIPPVMKKTDVRFYSQPDLSLCEVENESGSDADDSEEDLSACACPTVNMKKNRQLLIAKNKRLCGVLDKVDEGVREILSRNCQKQNRYIDPKAVDKDDFDCSLCMRLLWNPITTPCGHTYCKACLDRSLDHKRECPLCKTALKAHHRANMSVNEFIEETIRRMLPGEFTERQKVYEEEMADMIGASDDGKNTIPVFVCTMSFPNIPCPLHVFEPRYRLMIRRTMETGTREFGMCTNAPNKPFSDYGTMLEIRDIQYFPDGRSVVDTMGGRRFKVLERGTKDGYATAKVEFLHDVIPNGQELQELQQLHDRTRALAVSWFERASDEIKAGILSHYGAMPALEQDYVSSSSGPAWTWWVLAILPLDSQAQQQILSQIHLKKRLEAISRILGFMRRRGSF